MPMREGAVPRAAAEAGSPSEEATVTTCSSSASSDQIGVSVPARTFDSGKGWCPPRRFLPSCNGEGGLTSFSPFFAKWSREVHLCS